MAAVGCAWLPSQHTPRHCPSLPVSCHRVSASAWPSSSSSACCPPAWPGEEEVEWAGGSEGSQGAGRAAPGDVTMSLLCRTDGGCSGLPGGPAGAPPAPAGPAPAGSTPTQGAEAGAPARGDSDWDWGEVSYSATLLVVQAMVRAMATATATTTIINDVTTTTPPGQSVSEMSRNRIIGHDITNLQCQRQQTYIMKYELF